MPKTTRIDVKTIARLAQCLGLTLVVYDPALDPKLATGQRPSAARRVLSESESALLTKLRDDAGDGGVAVSHLDPAHPDGNELVAFNLAGDLCVVSVGPANPRLPSEGALRELYGLTRTEATVAVALATDMSPKEIAKDFGVGLSTVRSHLRAVRVKVGASSQTDLVRRLIASAASYAGPMGPDAGLPSRDGSTSRMVTKTTRE